jgi:capsular polysaccharide transport system permease protein
MSNSSIKRASAPPQISAPRVDTLEMLRLDKLESACADRSTLKKQTVKALVGRYWLFLLLVVLPSVFAMAYFGIIAADRYVSETKFVIRAPAAASTGGVATLMRGEASSRVADDTHAVNAFMMSRDAASELARDHGLRDVMSRSDGDLFSRFPNFHTPSNDEKFFEAYKRFVHVEVNSSTGISTLKVSAFRPEDAQRTAAALLNSGENFINRLRERSSRDEIAFAVALLEEARIQLVAVVTRLSDYRNEQQTLNPQEESTTRLVALTKFATEISQLEAALAQQIALAPQSPGIMPMREKIRSLRDELDRQRKVLVGYEESLATKFQEYELLMVERELASRALIESVVRMETARQEGKRQSLYLQRIVEPNLPDYPASPYRFFGVMLSILISLVLFWLCKNMMRLTLEHRP